MDVYSFHQSILNGDFNLVTWIQWRNESLELLLKLPSFQDGNHYKTVADTWFPAGALVQMCQYGLQICNNSLFYWNSSKQPQTSATSNKTIQREYISDGHQLHQSIHKFSADPVVNCSLRCRFRSYGSTLLIPLKQECRNKEKVMAIIFNCISSSQSAIKQDLLFGDTSDLQLGTTILERITSL